MESYEKQFFNYLQSLRAADPAHDIGHISRVVTTAKKLARLEGARADIVVPAAWLHDCVNISKDSPLRKQASRLAAKQAIVFLQSIHYPTQLHTAIAHAIEAHSYSAGIKPESLEACVLQDADRIDALGAIGISRLMLVGGALGTPLYQQDDPFCHNREPQEHLSCIDHFYEKLMKLENLMNTPSGKEEAHKRTQSMLHFISTLKEEVGALQPDLELSA